MGPWGEVSTRQGGYTHTHTGPSITKARSLYSTCSNHVSCTEHLLACSYTVSTAPGMQVYTHTHATLAIKCSPDP